jgi:hypothetical protein
LRLELLDTQHVGTLPREPVEEALARCRSQTVGVEGDDSHRKLTSDTAAAERARQQSLPITPKAREALYDTEDG